MKPMTRDAIVRDLAGILADFNGKEYSGEIGSQTLFFADLGLVSIDAVILAEHLETTYGRHFAFGDFLSQLRDKGARDIAVGELARFLESEMASEGVGP